jgi:hypothetical protein
MMLENGEVISEAFVRVNGKQQNKSEVNLF